MGQVVLWVTSCNFNAIILNQSIFKCLITSGVARRMIEMWHSGCAREKIVRGFRGVRSERIQRTERSRN